jgi:hypothetical protein
MPFLAEPTFNPSVSKVPILGPSSGDPRQRQDPKSTASIGANIQAMQDQAKADMLYDAPVKEGFVNSEYVPWIVNSPACKRVQGFTDMNFKPIDPFAALLLVTGAILIVTSFL